MPREDLERLLPSGVLQFVYDTYRINDHTSHREAEAVPGAGVRPFTAYKSSGLFPRPKGKFMPNKSSGLFPPSDWEPCLGGGGDEQPSETKSPWHRSRWADVFDQNEKKKVLRGDQENWTFEDYIEDLKKREQASGSEGQAVPGAGFEPAPFNGVDAVDDGDNRPLDDGPGNVGHRTRETAHMEEQEEQKPEEQVNRATEDVVDGTYKDSDGHNSDGRLPDGTSGDSANEPEKEALDDTSTMRAGRNGHVQALHNTREETGSHDYQPLDGTCEEPVTSSPDNQFLEDIYEAANEDDHGDGSGDSTHDETGNSNRGIQSHDDTYGEHVVIEGEGTSKGTREETSDNVGEEADGGVTPVQHIAETSGDVVPGEHDESSGNGTHEAPIAGAPQDSSSHHEHESRSQPQSNPPRHRGRPRFVHCQSLNKWVNNAVAGRDKDNTPEH